MSPRLSKEQVEELLREHQWNRGIARGIAQAWRDDGGKGPIQGEPNPIMDVFNSMWSGG